MGGQSSGDAGERFASLNPNYAFCLEYAQRIAKARPEAKVLDYGCGAGQVVKAGRLAGLDVWGVDVYSGDGSDRKAAQESGLLRSAIFEMKDDRIPFGDGTFDLVTANQVFEHVRDLGPVLDEISRVLKPGGRLLTIFPSKDVLREGHCGIPFLHWFGKGSRLRYYHALAFRSLGLGYHKGSKSRRQWARDFIAYLDGYTFYRSRSEIRALLGKHFDVAFAEKDLIKLRAGRVPAGSWIRNAADVPVLGAAGVGLFRLLAGLTIVATKRQ